MHERRMIASLALVVSFGVASRGLAKAAPPEPGKPDAPEASKPASDEKGTAGGHLAIEKPLVDVGEVVRGQLATAVFEIRNTGDGILKILDARPG